MAGILGSLSPPGEDQGVCLTAEQTYAVLTPHWPTSHVDNWTLPEDPRGPTTDDLRYSEFTHNWSGVSVILLGLGWLAQTSRGRLGTVAAQVTPFLLVPFGLFVGIAANPEVYLLHFVGPWEALTNPQILEHQFSAVLLFVLAWLSWRDRKNPPALRPLGYPLPIVMIIGSLLLLGHAHSNPEVPDGLTNLINVPHAIFGACGLFAGAVRWCELRGLIRTRWADVVWPALIIALGISMAFVYRSGKRFPVSGLKRFPPFACALGVSQSLGSGFPLLVALLVAEPFWCPLRAALPHEERTFWIAGTRPG